ncbi:unnamed protein product [Ostreobium quekettii]|uniref:Protein kinase domain-containing protein n=1 Tax=Ostreobium quekettii TaxID=121088 RepID=A0A8S1JIL6_9CHLO|nr:unnamed protein product [Ostreobium quekettii]|eukprot:evm.model.scf_1135.4 EVM.evm.TU.scf_1135.4   scf_1135:33501-37813(-)
MKFSGPKSGRKRDRDAAVGYGGGAVTHPAPSPTNSSSSASVNSRPQGRGLREAFLSWLHRLVAGRGRKVSATEQLTSHNIEQLSVSSAQEPPYGARQRFSLRSNSDSICSYRVSTQSRDSAVSKSSTDFYFRGGNSRRAALDLSDGSQYLSGAAPVREVRSNTSIISAYTLFRTTHRGSHAKIMKARHKRTHERVALKVYNKEQIAAILWQNISKEIRILTMANGVNGIVQMSDSFEDDNQAVVALEDCMGGTLISQMAQKGGQLSERTCVKTVVKPLLEALAWFHSSGIVLRDLKPEHIMFDSTGKLRLVDFFSAAIVGEDSLVSREGTLAYMAPEMVNRPTPEEVFNEVIGNGLSEADFPAYTEKVDIWSLGVIIFEALTGRQPFLAETAEDMRDMQDKTLASHGGLRTSLDSIKMREYMSPCALDFLTSVMRIDPDERPSAEELLDHPWVMSACKAPTPTGWGQDSTESFVSTTTSRQWAARVR